MTTIQTLCDYLARLAPPALAEEWDNVGLLLGDRDRPATRVMTCLTITGEVVAEAVQEGVELIVAHHPLPFRPLKRITTDTATGRLLWRLIGAGVAVYSPHTAFDSAAEGINQQLAAGLGLQAIRPLVPAPAARAVEGTPSGAELGAGRWGRFHAPLPLRDLAALVCRMLRLPGIQVAGPEGQLIERVGIACGSGGSFLEAAVRQQCQALVTGEASFHTCLEAEACGVTLLLAGHYGTERPAVEWLATHLAGIFPDLRCWASRSERDPIFWLAGGPGTA